MPFWRRDDETLQEQLKRELEEDRPRAEPEQPEPPVPKLHYSTRGQALTLDSLGLPVPGPSDHDVNTVVTAPEIPGDVVQFLVLADGTLLVEEAETDASLAAIAETVERSLAPPYRVRAGRDHDVWVVSADAVETYELPEEVDGDSVELAVTDEGTTLLIDGAPQNGTIPSLEQLGRERCATFAVVAQRIDGSLWEVEVSEL